ncbi:hypothetical protein SSX86_022063 [Deinandra increscens subsp. villosa]|uniref:Uncharacterized protein n=1 Tax=Deinandra increscens subsp. villosa TaxID=3103831 RepID=A0AAP0CLM5_9ASTR
MKFDNHILLVMISIISLFFLFFILTTEGAAPSKEEDETYDQVKNALNEAKEKLGPVSPSDFDLEEAKEALGPIPSFGEAKEALGPVLSPAAIEKAREALSPISPAAIDKAKKALGPASSKAQEALGPSSSGVIDKARAQLDSIASWITQSKAAEGTTSPSETPVEAPSPVSPLDPYGILEGAKQNFDSLLDSITQEKEQEQISSSGPAASNVDIVSTSPTSSPSPAADSSSSDLSKILDKAKEKFSSISSYISLQQNNNNNKVQLASSVYLDHDVALAVESMIKQAQSNAQLAADEAKTLFSDPVIDSSDPGKCVKICMGSYESSTNKLNKAMEDLKARNVELLRDDIRAVEGEILACQKCFQEHDHDDTKTTQQSPFHDLEEATIKATHECLNVLNHSA